jgi:hypothetical protein
MSSADGSSPIVLARLYNKKFLVIMTVVIVAAVFDALLIKINDPFIIQISSTWRIFLFLIASCFLIVGQLSILKLLKPKIKGIQESVLHVQTLFLIVTIVQYGQIIPLAILIFQIVFSSTYNTILLFIITTLSCSIATLMLILLTYRFLSWFKIRRSYEILLYGIASATITISIMFALGSLELIIQRAPNVVTEDSRLFHTLLPADSQIRISQAMHNLFSVISFIMTWAATFTLLRYYSKKIGRVLYCIILSSPLVYFISLFVVPFGVLVPIVGLDPVHFAIALALIFNISKTAGGILFGASFWTISKGLSHDNILKDYLLIAGLGFLLLFISNSLIPTSISYPPFGTISIMFIGFSSFLVLLGVYSSAVTISENTKIRQSIRKLAIREHELLEQIGMAQMEEKIQKKVLYIIKEQQQNVPIHPTVKDEEIKTYVADVIKEIKAEKNQKIKNDEEEKY